MWWVSVLAATAALLVGVVTAVSAARAVDEARGLRRSLRSFGAVGVAADELARTGAELGRGTRHRLRRVSRLAPFATGGPSRRR